MMTHPRIRIALLIALLAPAALLADVTVYVTKTGAKYHRDGCSSLSRSRIPMELKAATARFEPCKVCRPPVLAEQPPASSRAPSTATRSTRCAATTKKGTQCLRNTAAGSAYCWQHGR
jgi:hypothetical protein